MYLLVETFEQGCLVERQSVEKSVEKENALCQKALGRKKGRKAISIVCLKTSHMVEILIFSFNNMTRFEANEQLAIICRYRHFVIRPNESYLHTLSNCRIAKCR